MIIADIEWDNVKNAAGKHWHKVGIKSRKQTDIIEFVISIYSNCYTNYFCKSG